MTLTQIKEDTLQKLSSQKIIRIKDKLFLEYLDYLIDNGISPCENRYDTLKKCLDNHPELTYSALSMLENDIIKLEKQMKCPRRMPTDYPRMLDLLDKDIIFKDLLTFDQFLYLLEGFSTGKPPVNGRDNIILILAWHGYRETEIASIKTEDVVYHESNGKLEKVEITLPDGIIDTFTEPEFMRSFELCRKQTKHNIVSAAGNIIELDFNMDSPYYIKKTIRNKETTTNYKIRNASLLIERQITARKIKGLGIDWKRHNLPTIQTSGIVYAIATGNIPPYTQSLIFESTAHSVEYYNAVATWAKEAGIY